MLLTAVADMTMCAALRSPAAGIHKHPLHKNDQRNKLLLYTVALSLQGRDHTIYALTEGYVKFAYNKLMRRRTIGVQLLPQQPHQQQRQEQTALKQIRLQLP